LERIPVTASAALDPAVSELPKPLS
jgi:hypothetical protein